MQFLPAFLKFPRITRVSVEALALLVAILGGEASASASSSWSTSSNWAAPESPSASSTPSTTSRTRVRNALNQEQKYNGEIAPFSPGSNNLSLEMGQVFLMGNLGASYSDSIGTSLRYSYGVSDLFAFESALGYSNHADGKFSMMSMQAGLRTNLAWYDKVIPYASFGLGFYKPSYTFDGSTQVVNTIPGAVATTTGGTSVSPLLFGVHLGPGVDLQLTRSLFFGASLIFHDIFSKTELTADNKAFDVGGTYTSFFVHAGYTF